MSGPLLTWLCNGVSLAVGLVTVPSLLILGTDAVLAAAPATPIQLAHACLAAGYAAAIPASWGDELIAAHVMREVRAADSPRLQCSCPHVEKRLLANGASIAPLTITTVAPPVATALYLRAKFAPREIRVAFAGACPSGAHASIDVWLMPAALSALLTSKSIDPRTQPTEFDSVIPPDRRRFYSEPGGMPSRRRLLEGNDRINLVELGGGDLIVEVAQQLLRAGRSLVDVAASHGCTCSGAAGLAGLEYARARVQEREPPPAMGPVLDDDVPLPIGIANRPKPPEPPATATPAAALEPVMAAAPRRRSPPGMHSAIIIGSPQARSDAGRPLRRAYIAKRRSSPKGIRRLTSPTSGQPVVAEPVAEPARWTSRLRRWVERAFRAMRPG
jgi:hypothetical protein